MSHPLAKRLRENPFRRKLVEHEFFRQVQDAPVTREQAAIFIGQWWHPLHYFPTFLARSVAVLPDIDSKSAIARILNQEAGEGSPTRAHEVIYADTMKRAGFTYEQSAGAAPYRETATLVDGYQRAANARLSALGFVFATEVADLVMVSGIGAAVRRATGATDLEWVDIHVEQEPDHVEHADYTMMMTFDEDEENSLVESAEEMWRLWIAFFDRLQQELFGRLHASEVATVASAAPVC